MRLTRPVFVLLFGLAICVAAKAQDTRSVREPRFPPVCSALRAPLESTPAGPSLASEVTVQDAESSAETRAINDAIQQCRSGYAVELALGSDLQHNAFLINPLTFPPGVSLIIDGGVTVYASRNPTNYQITNPQNYLCGTVTDTMLNGVCQPVLNFLGDENTNRADSGLYGYGVLDGQGQTLMLWPSNPTGTAPPPPTTWWGLRLQAHNEGGDVNENSPKMVSGGDPPNGPANNFTMYKITIRNPPFHTVVWGGHGLTVWGVRIQAPWNEPNTDGFDLHGSDATLYDTIVSNGDDDIAFAVNQSDTKNITVRHFSAYARDGITVLGNGNGKYSISNLLLDDIMITGDLPSVVTTTVNQVTTGTVNGVSEESLKRTYNVTGYAQALPNANGDVHGLNIKYQSASSQTNVTFRNVCIQDVRTPLNIEANEAPGATTKVDDILFQNIHVLAPNPQYLNYNYGTGASGAPGTGRYKINFGGVQGKFYPQFTLSNVVFDDLPFGQGTPISSIFATGNKISTATNIYPAVFNDLSAPYVEKPKPSPWQGTNLSLTLSDNSYSAPQAPISTPRLANRCARSVPFLTGELFASSGTVLAAGGATNLNAFTTTEGSSISLNAVVQPIMSQTTFALPGNTSEENIVAIASPSLTSPINFYDGYSYVGSAGLSANGTLATLQIEHIRRGWHIFSAQYPKDRFYSNLSFGSVVVYASPN
jgi:polygalacturonase